MRSPYLAVLEWIAAGDGKRGTRWRLGLVIAALFLWVFVENVGSGLPIWWWVIPAVASALLLVPFCLWRLLEHRRRVKRRAQSVEPLDLGQATPDRIRAAVLAATQRRPR